MSVTDLRPTSRDLTARGTTTGRGRRTCLGVVALAGVALALTGCSKGTSVGGSLGTGKAGNAGQQAFSNLQPSGTATAVATAFAAPTSAGPTVVVKTQQATTNKSGTSSNSGTKTTTVTTKAPVVSRSTAAKTTTKTAAPQQAATKPFDIGIYGDSDSAHPALDPAQAAVYVGTKVIFTNHDTVPRSVLAQNGEFQSPTIAPGASYTYTATDPGTISYQDGTRPYVDGQLQVVAK